MVILSLIMLGVLLMRGGYVTQRDHKMTAEANNGINYLSASQPLPDALQPGHDHIQRSHGGQHSGYWVCWSWGFLWTNTTWQWIDTTGWANNG